MGPHRDHTDAYSVRKFKTRICGSGDSSAPSAAGAAGAFAAGSASCAAASVFLAALFSAYRTFIGGATSSRVKGASLSAYTKTVGKPHINNNKIESTVILRFCTKLSI